MGDDGKREGARNHLIAVTTKLKWFFEVHSVTALRSIRIFLVEANRCDFLSRYREMDSSCP